MALIVSFDGPKAVGKTTLIERVRERLTGAGHEAAVLVEKELLPPAIQNQLASLYATFRAAPTAAADQAIADALRAGRADISTRHLAARGGIVLLDRWYPSDAVFRRYLSAQDLVANNIAAGARVPDLVIALVCAPEVSWKRAHQRQRSLDSKVIADYDSHAASTDNFRQAAATFDWMLMESDRRTPDELALAACKAITATAQNLHPASP
ncbi:AAA family ATPase [Massilia oculi]|uniref:AAA family ATPase n=1 Tax=Massilia oculi TaxID=945844 RepID=UPI001AAFBDF1|nr:AAA family ATPase [Massilia oculi]